MFKHYLSDITMRHFFIYIGILSNLLVYGQDAGDTDEASSTNNKGLSMGLSVGAYFANKHTALLYDGYGFDVEGNRQNFENSFMYNKIVLEYGGGYGQTDYIAQELGVAHGEWTFNESDMPNNMRYMPAFIVGLQARYSVDSKNAILVNVNGSKINVSGNFTITTTSSTPINQVPKNIQTFAIRGVEQRLLLQFGYQRLLGESEKFNVLVEGGLNVTIAKFDKNEILINNLLIDLTQSLNSAAFPSYVIRKPVGTGFGAFAGLGVNASMSDNVKIQLVYNPTYEQIKLGKDSKLKFQHSINLRMYYNF